jgi:FkbM family methyltransferase
MSPHQASSETIKMGNLVFPLDREIITEDVFKALKRGNYEQEELNGLKKIVDHNTRALELGAGIGFISAYLRSALNVPHVTCIEANPKLASYIRKMHDLNKITDTDIFSCVAVPDNLPISQKQAVPFYITEPFWSSSLAKPRQNRIREVIETPVRALSELIRESEATVIVCDIEGGENGLFEAVDFGRVEHVFLELHAHRIRGDGVRNVFDSLHRHGFAYDQSVSFRKIVNFRRW